MVVAGKEQRTFFRGLQFLHKKKLKSEIFNDKRSLQTKMFLGLGQFADLREGAWQKRAMHFM